MKIIAFSQTASGHAQKKNSLQAKIVDVNMSSFTAFPLRSKGIKTAKKHDAL